MVAAQAPARGWTNGPDISGKRRLVADRFRRIWAIVARIADEPGHTRAELAGIFHLSERQVQADLAIVRTDMRLPLVRRQGYRFVREGPNAGAGGMDLKDGQLLVMILAHALRDRSIPDGRVRTLLGKIVAVFPPHLAPLVQRTVEAVTTRRGSAESQVFAALADALVRGVAVKLHPAPGSDLALRHGTDLVIRPELLLPYLDSWHVVGERRSGGPGYERTRSLMLPLDAVTTVTLAAEAP